MKMLENIVLVLVPVIILTWLIIKAKRPNLLGYSKDRIKQRMKATGLQPCPSCKEGLLEPRFRWWRYFISFAFFPFGLYIKGKPDVYRCTDCGEIIHKKLDFSSWTKYSYTQDLPLLFVIMSLVPIILGFIIVGIIIIFFLDKFLPIPR